MQLLGSNLFGDALAQGTTAILAGGEVVALGPAGSSQSITDEVHLLWLVVGKMIYLRNLGTPFWRSPSSTTGYYYDFRQAVMATLDQFVDGDEDDDEGYQKVISPFVTAMNKTVDAYLAFEKNCDDAVVALMRSKFAKLVGADPKAPIDTIAQAVKQYMATHGIRFEDSDHGFRDYLLGRFKDPDGLPLTFPTSGTPNVPDSWISRDVTLVVTGGVPSPVILLTA